MRKNIRKPKPTGIVVSARIPEGQFNAIKQLDGTLGVGLNGVVANIIHSWFTDQEWFVDIIKDKIKNEK